MCFLFLRFGGLFYEENEDVLPHSGTSFVLFVWVIINRPRAVMLAFAEYERGMIVERTQTGRAIARQDPDFREGRPKKLKPEQIDLALSLLAQGKTYRHDRDQ